MLQESWLFDGILRLIPLVLSLSVHEWAHAYAAFCLGDDTAAQQGRMTLNPLAHMDPLGTFLLPLLGVPFGWAKPVPINPVRFRRDVSLGTGVVITAAAGPLSNLLLALMCAVLRGVQLRFGLDRDHRGVEQLLTNGLELNVLLFLFNLLPIPPLDGSRIVDGLIPYRHRRLWNRVTGVSWLARAVMLVIGVTLLIAPLLWFETSLDDVITSLAY